MPPSGAPLVLAHTDRRHQLQVPEVGHSPGIYAPAFLLEDKPGGAVVLRGAERRTVSVPKREPAWRKFSLDRVKPTPGGYETDFRDPATLVCAVQLAARGDADTARDLLDRFAADDPDRLTNAPRLLAECAYDHQWDRLLRGPANWPDVRTRMAALFHEFPGLETDDRHDLLTDLTATLGARPPKAGSVEALVLDWAGRPGRHWMVGLFGSDLTSGADDPARRVVLRGFEAVPDLIALLGDRRITAREQPAFNTSPARIRRVGELAEYLLYQIAGAGAPSAPGGPGPNLWRVWWESARRGSERDYFTAAIFTTNGNRITRVHEGVAHVIARKWPEVLPGLCEQYTERADPTDAPFGLADALADARLPKEERVKALAAFAERGPLPHRRWVLQVLTRLDAKTAAEILRPVLGRFPRDTDGEYWRCPEAYFTQVVVAIDDDGIWREYLRVVKRSGVGLRMQAMYRMTDLHLGTTNRPRRLAFLAAFLTDETVRDTSDSPRQYAGPCAGSSFARLAVRDLAAMELARMLELDDDPDNTWDAGQWARLRERVRGKLAAERLPDLGPGR
jgi:hypothetical protein